MVLRRGGRALVHRPDQLAAVEMADGRLHRALGEAGVVGDPLVADARAPGAAVARAAPEMEVDGEGGGRLVVAHQVAHQGVENVVVDRYRFHRYSDRHYSSDSHPRQEADA